jgi:hypothetical protein
MNDIDVAKNLAGQPKPVPVSYIPCDPLSDTSGNRFWKSALLVLILLQCTPVWFFSYVPSSDGPSHLHNAQVLANPGIAIYREYYAITPFQPAGNMLTQVFLAALLKLAAPFIAEKLLLTFYILSFFASFYYFLRTLTPYPDYIACCGGILVSNLFLYLGFWNFLYSVCLALFTLGYYLRHRQIWTTSSLAVLVAAGFLTYMTHALSWIVCVVAVAILGMPGVSWHAGYPRLSRLQTVALGDWAKPVCCLLPPLCFLFLYWGRTLTDSFHLFNSPSVGQQSIEAVTLLQRIFRRFAPLYDLSCLYSFNNAERVWAEVVGGMLLIILLSLVGRAYWTREYNHWNTPMLLTSVVCFAIAIGGPARIGSGTYIRLRVEFYAVIFLVAWMGSAFRSQRRLALNMVAALFCCLSLVGVAIRIPELSRWNERLSAVYAIGQHIRSGSTVLQLNLSYPPVITPEKPSPYKHCAGLISAAKPIVDLKNYEASTTYFLTVFRSEVRPFPTLGTLEQLELAPPIFDIRRYQSETRGRVDYLLFQGGGSSGRDVHGLERDLYRGQIDAYRLVASVDQGNLRLYERVPGVAIASGR